jgi:hypothetical protein
MRAASAALFVIKIARLWPKSARWELSACGAASADARRLSLGTFRLLDNGRGPAAVGMDGHHVIQPRLQASVVVLDEGFRPWPPSRLSRATRVGNRGSFLLTCALISHQFDHTVDQFGSKILQREWAVSPLNPQCGCEEDDLFGKLASGC